MRTLLSFSLFFSAQLLIASESLTYDRVATVDSALSDPALRPPAVNISPGPEYDATTRQWEGIPTVERTSKGRLWVSWYAGGASEGPFNYVVLVTSKDNGRTWSKPKVVIDPEWYVRACDPLLWIDPQGRLWLFWAQGTGLFDGRFGVWAIVTRNPDVDTPKWSKPRRISNGLMLNKPTVTANGDWLLPIGGWKNIKPQLNLDGVDLSPYTAKSLIHDIGTERASNVFRSRDQGTTFERAGAADIPKTEYDEHMLVERRNGSLWMLARTLYGIGQSESFDGGKSWSPGKKYLNHPATRFFVRRLQSGALLMVRHNAPAGLNFAHLPPLEQKLMTRSHLAAFVSDDEGASWTGGLMLDERFKVSYPDGLQTNDGTICVVYDRERFNEREILMATFREEDARAGRAVSGNVRLGVVVSKGGHR